MGVLRLLLALLVVNSHMLDFGYKNFLAGGDAVKIFFAISGFYMALILNGKYKSSVDFYVNRYLRLYPSYAVVLAASVIWFWLITFFTHQKPPPFWIYEANKAMPSWQYGLLQFSNLTMVGLDVPSLFHWSDEKGFLFLHYADGDTAPDGAWWGGQLPWIRQAWSVGTEIWFYILAPFVVRRQWSVQLAVMVASLGTNLAMSANGLWTYYFFPANLWLFMLGSLLFAIYPRIEGVGRRWGWPVLVAVVAVCASAGSTQDAAMRWSLILVVIAAVPFLFARFSAVNWDNAIGELSYPVYLIHMLVISAMRSALHLNNTILTCLATVAVGLVLVRYVEEPMNRYRQYRHRKAIQGPRVSSRAEPIGDVASSQSELVNGVE